MDADKPDYWSTWRYVEKLSLDEAARLLAGVDPLDTKANSSAVEAYYRAILTGLSDGSTPLDFDTFAIKAGKGRDKKAEKSIIGWGLIGTTKNMPHPNIDGEQSIISSKVLAAWADSKGIPHHWPRLQSDEADNTTATSKPAPAFPYTEELQAAIDAYEAVRGNPAALERTTPKRALLAWLEENRANLGSKARERIATMCNWEPQGGAPQTPTGRG